MDAAGNLYGTTSSGGAYSFGTVYELVANAKGTKFKEKVLHSFCESGDCEEGNNPSSSLIMDTAGNLYGTTPTGASGYSWGTVFELTANRARTRWTYHLLYRFCAQQSCGDGSFPEAALSYAGQTSGAPYDGKSPLFGTTSEGGAHAAGVLFELTRVKKIWTETVIHSFCSEGGSHCTDGGEPVANVVVDASQNLYGVTPQGGAGMDNAGVAFEFSPSGNNQWTETILYNFCSLTGCADGLQSYGGVIMDAAGDLLGTTGNGGNCSNVYDCGVVFRVTPSGNENVLYSFCALPSCADGYDPHTALVMDGSGDLFGTTTSGGSSGGGTLFELNGTMNVLYNFCSSSGCTDGNFPDAPLIMNQSGDLFGTAGGGANNNGVVFEFTL
jgi:uncharacterized repeat protein (TIGR03803 family)